MKKYKNISDFRQLVKVDQKRVFLNPGEIIECEKELKYIFLSEVLDDLSQKYSENHHQKEQTIKRDSEKHLSSVSSYNTDTIKQILEFIEHQKQFNEDLEREIKILKNSLLTIQKDIYDIEPDLKENQNGREDDSQPLKIKKDIKEKLEFFVIEENES